MRESKRRAVEPSGWTPSPDPDGRYSSGIADFDRLLGGGFERGSMALLRADESVRREDLDRILGPVCLNFLYQSRGIVAILPSNDTPHEFRERLTRYVTRRRFDSRVRIMDYVGEDEGRSYVVNFRRPGPEPGGRAPSPRGLAREIAKATAAEKAAQGGRDRGILELVAFEIFDTLMGSERAARTFFHGVKRSKQLGNLALGILGPGVGCAAALRRMADTEFELHRDEVGLIVRGVHPEFPGHVVSPDLAAGPPHLVFVPRPE